VRARDIRVGTRYAQLTRNGNSDDNGPDVWITPPTWPVMHLPDTLAQAIARSTGADLAAVRTAMDDSLDEHGQIHRIVDGPAGDRTDPAGDVTKVTVRGLAMICWKCHRPTTMVVGMHRASAIDGDLVTCADEQALATGGRVAARYRQRQSRPADQGPYQPAHPAAHQDRVSGETRRGSVSGFVAVGSRLVCKSLLAEHREELSWHVHVSDRPY
jgi:hypothetical protein